MLVIRRRGGQGILIGGDIEVQVIEVAGGRVKLGIRAPADIPVARSEVALAGAENRRAAACGSSPGLTALAALLRKKTGGGDAPADNDGEMGGAGAAGSAGSGRTRGVQAAADPAGALPAP